MANHSFDPDVASAVGVNAAVLFQNILYWVEKNAVNGRHFYDGATWTYNSVSAFAEMFQYMSISQVRTSLDKLLDAGLIGEGNYNKAGYDRTKWYCVLSPSHLSKIPNGIGVNRRPIPDGKPDGKQVEAKASFVRPSRFDEFWDAYPHRNGAKKGRKPSEGKYQAAVKSGVSEQAIIDGAFMARNDRGVIDGYARNPETWLNQGGWNDEIEMNVIPTGGSSNGGNHGNRNGTPRANGNGHGSGLFDAFAAVAADLEGKPH